MARNELKCTDCGYHWKEEGCEEYPSCHWTAKCPDDKAPCEEEPWWEEDEWEDPYWKEDERYTPSATAGDYSPACPWNAPGMSVKDFI